MLPMDNIGRRVIYQRKRCRQKIKTSLTQLSTGTAEGALNVTKEDEGKPVGTARASGREEHGNQVVGAHRGIPLVGHQGAAPPRLPSILREDKDESDYAPTMEDRGRTGDAM